MGDGNGEFEGLFFFFGDFGGDNAFAM